MKILMSILFVLLIQTVHAQHMIIPPSPLMTLIRPAVSDDSILVASLPPGSIVQRLVVVVDTADVSCDSIKIGTSGYSALLPGDVMLLDGAATTDGAIYGDDADDLGPALLPIGTWYVLTAERSLYCYFTGAGRPVQLRVYLYYYTTK